MFDKATRIIVIGFVIFLASCSNANDMVLEDEPLGPTPPEINEANQKPVVVRTSQNENTIYWDMAPNRIYSLTWETDANSPQVIENVTSPYIHSISDNSQVVYYRLKDDKSLLSLAGFTLVYEQKAIEGRIFISFADINDDGCLDVLFAINDCNGNLIPVSAIEMGLGLMNSSGRSLRDARFADFDGDGILDIVSNSYEEFSASAPTALLHFGRGGGTFFNSDKFEDIGARGRGETIVVADFDNDGDTDIFIPYYSYSSPAEHSYLLINDGTGTFVDVADSAGVALRDVPVGLRVEGVQAIDFDFDGDIDLVAASNLFVNQLKQNGKLEFESMQGFPRGFEEGIKFVDWDNDGDFDVVKQSPYNDVGPLLYEFDGIQTFTLLNDIFPIANYHAAFGLNIYDLNYDGKQDVIASGGRSQSPDEFYYPVVYINNGERFVKHRFAETMHTGGNDVMAFGDLDNDNMIDMIARIGNGVTFVNKANNPDVIKVTVVGPNGEKNQHGRPIKVFNSSRKGEIFTRSVDGGSGFITNNEYTIFIGLPSKGSYTIEVFFAGGTITVDNVNLGDDITVYEDGRIVRN